MADTMTTTPVREVHEPGDDEKFAHVVVPASAVTEAYLTGAPVTAVCGKTWVPTRDPEKFPICPECADFLKAARDREREQ